MKEEYPELNPQKAGKGDLKIIPTCPANMQVEESEEGLFIHQKWQSHALLSLFVGVGLAVGIMSLVLTVNGLSQLEGLSLIAFLSFIPFLLATTIGFGFGYLGLAMRYNSTTIHLNNKVFRKSTHPFPWMGGIRLATSEIESVKIVVKEYSNARKGEGFNTVYGMATGNYIAANKAFSVHVLYLKKRNDPNLIEVMTSTRKEDDEQLVFIEHKLKEQIRLLGPIEEF